MYIVKSEFIMIYCIFYLCMFSFLCLCTCMSVCVCVCVFVLHSSSWARYHWPPWPPHPMLLELINNDYSIVHLFTCIISICCCHTMNFVTCSKFENKRYKYNRILQVIITVEPCFNDKFGMMNITTCLVIWGFFLYLGKNSWKPTCLLIVNFVIIL